MHLCYIIVVVVKSSVAFLRVTLSVFRLDALALSVIATATSLGGWVAGCHSGIVSKRLNLAKNLFDRLKAPSF